MSKGRKKVPTVIGMRSTRCKICQSKHAETIDGMLDSGKKHTDILIWAEQNAPELNLNPTNISTHSRFHRPGRFEELLGVADERIQHIRDHYGGDLQLMQRMLELMTLDGMTQLLAGEKSVEPEVAIRAIRELRELKKLQLATLPETSMEKLGFFLYYLLAGDSKLLQAVTNAARSSDIEGAAVFATALEKAGGRDDEGSEIIVWRNEDEDGEHCE